MQEHLIIERLGRSEACGVMGLSVGGWRITCLVGYRRETDNGNNSDLNTAHK
jgi:hypothetical protein